MLPGRELLTEVATLVKVDPTQVVQVVLEGQRLARGYLLCALRHTQQAPPPMILILLTNGASNVKKSLDSFELFRYHF
jgi:hypothetical protein